ncbi:MAG: tyrosine-type recombinase/integrase [Proteobacteria bacterium]|nr:tyrosine-type recombinase/integrase [Pseudomonadota bacterium]
MVVLISACPNKLWSVPISTRSSSRCVAKACRLCRARHKRHAYATHLLEQGVHIRAIQKYLGHTKLETTMQYLHLTSYGQENAFRLINTVMRGWDDDQDK